MRYHVYRDDADEWRWELLISDGWTIAVSVDGYVDKAECLAAIDVVKQSRHARVEESL